MVLLAAAPPPRFGPGKRGRRPGLGEGRAGPAQTQPRPSSVGTPRRVAPGGQATRAAMTRGSWRLVACAACSICGAGDRAHTCGMCNLRVCGRCFWHANGLCSNCSGDPDAAPPFGDPVAADKGIGDGPGVPTLGRSPVKGYSGWPLESAFRQPRPVARTQTQTGCQCLSGAWHTIGDC